MDKLVNIRLSQLHDSSIYIHHEASIQSHDFNSTIEFYFLQYKSPTTRCLCTAEEGSSGKWRNSTSLESLQKIATEFESSHLMMKLDFRNNILWLLFWHMIKVVWACIYEYEYSWTENKECSDENAVMKHTHDREDEYLVCCYKDDDIFRRL